MTAIVPEAFHPNDEDLTFHLKKHKSLRGAPNNPTNMDPFVGPSCEAWGTRLYSRD